MVCCFGELLLRFSPQMNGKFIKHAAMPVFVGGAELNVATALSKWKQPVKYVTALPDNNLAKEIIENIAGKNIVVKDINISGERIGTYYLPQGSDLKNNAVIYDRNYSSFANLQPGDIDWDIVFEGVDWFHFSAISPALNEQAAAVCLEAVKAASAKKITVSVDLNYRAKLWQYGKQPLDVMPQLIKYCDVVMGNIWAAEKLAGIKLSHGFDATSGNKELYVEEAFISAAAFMKHYPACKTVANTFRFDDGDEGIKYFATINNKNEKQFSSTYSTKKVIDKIGSGDCFMGGLIYGLKNNYTSQGIIDFAAAAAFAKLQQKGDATTSQVEDVKKIIIANE